MIAARIPAVVLGVDLTPALPMPLADSMIAANLISRKPSVRVS